MKIFLFVSVILMFGGCASKEYLIKTEYVEVKIPVKCDLEIPKKPKFKGDFASAKALSAYYLEMERIAKVCTKAE